MKRMLGFLLILTLLVSCFSFAGAAGKPSIKEQPETQTIDENGTATFKIKAKGYQGITWYFVDPVSGEKTTARNIGKIFKSMKVSGQNKLTLTLKKVPADLNGWSIYCMISGNGYQVTSDVVQLFVRGAAPAETPVPTAQPAQEEAQQQEQSAESQPQEQETEVPAEQEQQFSEEGYPLDEMGNPIIPDREITITAQNALLYPLDESGNLSGDGAETLSFTNYANFAIKASAAVQYWTISGVRYEPFENVTGFKLTNVTESMDLSAKLVPVSSQDLDFSNLVQVTCEGCTFTYAASGLTSVASGSVPVGATITVMASDYDAAERGYSINGGEPEKEGKVSFRLKVTENTTVVLK